jgi:hypothetical protein
MLSQQPARPNPSAALQPNRSTKQGSAKENHLSILTALAFVPLPRKTIADPVIQRRATFIKQLEQQRELAREQGFEPTKRKWVVNVDGSKQLVTLPKRVKRWWRLDALGNCFLVLRYGNKIITLSAGRTAIAVGPKSKLVQVIDTVIAATKAGEMDAVLAAAQATFRKPKQTKLRKTARRA